MLAQGLHVMAVAGILRLALAAMVVGDDLYCHSDAGYSNWAAVPLEGTAAQTCPAASGLVLVFVVIVVFIVIFVFVLPVFLVLVFIVVPLFVLISVFVLRREVLRGWKCIALCEE